MSGRGPHGEKFVVGSLAVGSLARAMPLRWALVWLVIPNLAVILMWPVGGPPMGRYLLGFGALALLASQVPWLLARRLALAAMTLAIAVVYIGLTFNITLYNIEMLLPFLREVRPLRSPEYLLGGAVVLGAAVLAWRHAPRVPRFAGPRGWGLGMLAVLGLANLDNIATASTAGSYHGLPPAGTPFQSATRAAGVDHPSGERRHLVVILVEALGSPASAPERALFEADWNRPEWRARYDVQRGAVPYHGSTTSGELRELCGRWADYRQLDYAAVECLPERYARAGYRTAAWHAFDGSFFERTQWWPKLGFAELGFAGELQAKGARACGGVFPGACDDDVPGLIGARLKAADQPQLVYWVTLNTHLPVLGDAALGTQDCTFGGAALADGPPMLCRLFLLHHRLADAVTRMALDPALPPTDILIVGDHMPPFFQRDARVRFDGDHVPWVLLRAKAGAESAGS